MSRILPTMLVAAAVAAGAVASLPVIGTADRASAEENTAIEPAKQPPAVDTAVRGDVVKDTATPIPRTDRAGVVKSIERGVDYLVSSQNKNGSWGSPASNLYDIYAPMPGAYQAFECGASALALSALVETGGDRPGVPEAIERGAKWLLENHRVRRASVDAIYNTWAHLYSLETFARLAAREKDDTKKAAYRKAMAEALDMLQRYEYVEGGWGYYDFETHTQRPGPGATSFTTAGALIGLKMCEEQGLVVPEKLTKRAIWVVEQCRRPDNAFAYSFEHRLFPQGGVNKIKGSLARTPVCLLALQMWGRNVTPANIVKAFDDIEKHDRFLKIARKYPQPHETWYQNSGYFVFFGYYYAARMLKDLEPARRTQAAQHIADYLVSVQEKDGSSWDYQLYGYHKAYGTGYVLMALAKCRDALPAK